MREPVVRARVQRTQVAPAVPIAGTQAVQQTTVGQTIRVIMVPLADAHRTLSALGLDTGTATVPEQFAARAPATVSTVVGDQRSWDELQGQRMAAIEARRAARTRVQNRPFRPTRRDEPDSTPATEQATATPEAPPHSELQAPLTVAPSMSTTPATVGVETARTAGTDQQSGTTATPTLGLPSMHQ